MSIPAWLRHAARTGLHLVCDAVAVSASYGLAYLWRFHWNRWVEAFPISGTLPEWGLYVNMLWIVAPLWIMLFWYSARLYDNPWMSAADRFIKIVKGCFLGTVAALTATYIYSRLEYSRMMLIMALPVSVILVSLSHAVVLWVDGFIARHEAAQPVLLVGGGALAQVVRDRIHRRHPEAEIHALDELPALAEIDRILSRHPFCEMILFQSALSHERILEAAELCDSRGAAFKMLPDLLELRLGEVQMDHSLGLPAYRIQHGSMTRLNFAAKRAFDLAFCLLVLVLAGPLCALAALLIKLDSPGPALYRQKRLGLKGRVFEACKFRTMSLDAETRLASVKDRNIHDGPFFKAKDDPRVTRIGRWLRRFSLDEFPQFINVWKGEMSVVGPRPLALTTGEMEDLLNHFGETAKKRLNALPGITGLWQISGRSDVSSAQRFALDMFYIEHWSLGMDLEIILKTVPAMLSAKGAY